MTATRVGRPKTAEELDARLYDQRGIGWPGELEFYRGLAAATGGTAVLDVACGTGRVSRDLVRSGSTVTGIDRSVALIEVARHATAGISKLRFLVRDMRGLELEDRFGLAIVAGHAFHHLVTADDQVAALVAIRRHLVTGGRLAVHLDHAETDWLGALPPRNGAREEGEQILTDGASGARYRAHWAWTFDRAAEATTIAFGWDEIGPGGRVVASFELPPRVLRVVGRLEMEHALRRAGFEIEALYGAFDRSPYAHGSENQIWVARRPAE